MQHDRQPLVNEISKKTTLPTNHPKAFCGRVRCKFMKNNEAGEQYGY